MSCNEETVVKYLRAMEGSGDLDAIASLLAVDFLQVEYSSRFLNGPKQRNKAQTIDSIRRGLAAVVSQQHTLLDIITERDTVACTLVWRAYERSETTLGRRNSILETNNAMFFKLRAGLIARQTIYVCF